VAGAGAPGAVRGDLLHRRLVALMAARLALAVLSLGIALAVDTAVDLGIEDWRGLYGTVAFAFVATALYGVALPRVRQRTRFAAVNVATDIGIVSALVHFSGSADTVFAFLYLVIAVYGAMLFSRRGALAVAGLGSLAFGAVLALSRLWGAVPGSAAALPGPMLVGAWAIHSLAGYAAAALAGQLSSELRRTGEALRQRTHDLDRLWRLHRHTLDSLMSGLLTTDPDGRITSFNPEAERITGLRAAEALGRDVDLVLPEVRSQALAHAGAGDASRSRLRMPYRNPRGRELHLGVGAYVLRDDTSQPSGHVVIFQDVSEVVAMERELRRSERLAAVGRLSASMAHEIRNPLAAISGSIQILRSERGRAPTGEEARRLMDIVLRETERLNRLLTEFLEYARPGPLRLISLPVEEVVAEVLAIFDAARPPGVEVVVEVEPALCLHADPGGIRQVLWNLLLNAAQAMPEGGTIAVCARPAPQEGFAAGRNAEEGGHWVELGVRDAGVGIPPSALEHIFDPFFTTKPGGTGLGLATVHRIVEEHGGSIRVQSAEGKGTSFQVRLRRAGGRT